MSEAICNYLKHLDKGDVHHMSELRTRVDLAGGRQAPTWLCAIENNLWIAAYQEGVGIAIEAPFSTLGLTTNFWGVALKVGEQPYAIPTAGISAVKEVIASARLYRPESDRNPNVAYDGPFIEQIEPHWNQWLLNNLFKEETLIALLKTNESSRLKPLIPGASQQNYRFMLTDQRCGLLAVSDLGDEHFIPLKREALIVKEGAENMRCQSGDRQWSSTSENGKTYETLSLLTPLTPGQRLREAALLMHIAEGAMPSHAAARIKAALMKDKDPFNQFIGAWWTKDPSLRYALAKIMKQPERSIEIVKWAKKCQLSRLDMNRLLKFCSERAKKPYLSEWFLPIHDLRRKSFPDEKGSLEAIQTDLEYFEHLLFAGQTNNVYHRAKALFETCPSEGIHSLLPAPNASPLAMGAPPYFRQRSISLQIASKEKDAELTDDEIKRLARCAPLDPINAKRLANTDCSQKRKEGRMLLELLNGNGLKRSISSGSNSKQGHIEKVEWKTLSHQTLQEEGCLSEMIQWLRSLEEGSYSEIKTYCNPINTQSNPKLIQFASDICELLNMTMPEIYELRGERSHGVACHAIPKRILAIGAEHLNPASERHLSDSELKAAMSAALFSLKMGYHKLLSERDWQSVIENPLSRPPQHLIPSFRQIPNGWMEKNRPIAGYVFTPAPWLSEIYKVSNLTTLLRLSESEITKDSGDFMTLWSKHLDLDPVTNREEDAAKVTLLAAYRAMVISTDRAAFILSGNLTAAIRRIFLTHQLGLPLLKAAEEKGVVNALNQPSPNQFQAEAAIRINALLTFLLMSP